MPAGTEEKTRRNYLLFYALTLSAGVLLLWTAFLNKYPLVFLDSEAYILYPSHFRSVGYHYFVKYLSMRFSLWPVILVQSLITACLLMRVSCLILKTAKHKELIAFSIIAVLALAPDISKFVCWIMPDISTSWSLLGGMLFFLSAERYDRLLAGGAVALFLLFHNSHVLITVLSLVTLGAAGAVTRPKMPVILEVAKKLGLIFAAALIVACALNYHVGFGFKPFPPQKWRFTLAKFEQYGILSRTLEKYCPMKKWKLCAYAEQLKSYGSMDNDKLMWGEKSPIVRCAASADPDEAGEISWYAFKLDPLTVLKCGILETFTMVNDFDTREELKTDDVVIPAVRKAYPNELKYFLNSDQQRGLPIRVRILPVKDRIFKAFVISCAVIWIVLLLFYGQYRLLSCVLAAALFILFNAAVTASISVTHARYNMRVMWLIPYILLLTVAAFVSEKGFRKSSPAGS